MTKIYSAHALRRGRVSIPGQIYLITTATRARRPAFHDLRHARAVVRALMRCESAGEARTLAYVVMPDHLHWLMQLGAGRALSSVVGRMKSGSSRLSGQALWNTGFHDRALRIDEDLTTATRYIVANPVRARLVNRVGDYPHWDAIWL